MAIRKNSTVRDPYTQIELIDVDPTAGSGYNAPEGLVVYSTVTQAIHVKTAGGPQAWSLVPSNAIATSSSAGLMSAAQAAFLASIQPGSMVPATLGPSTEVDFTTTPTAQTLFPKISTPGVMFVPWLFRWVITAKAGTLSTQPTLQMGNNVALTNLFASGSLSFASPFTAGVGAPTSSTVPANAAALTDASLQDYQITVSVAATGSGLTLKAKLFIIGFYTTLIQ